MGNLDDASLITFDLFIHEVLSDKSIENVHHQRELIRNEGIVGGIFLL